MMDRHQLLLTYRAMLLARTIDRTEKELVNRGEAYFHLSGAGHDALAALQVHLGPQDWLHCHYRDRSLLLARGVSARSFFDNLFSKQASSSRGRRMSPFFSDPSLNILSMVTPTANNALQSVGVAAAVKNQPGQPLVYCGVGDGSTQQGEFLEAIGEAVRSQLPVLFLVQDNRLAISTSTTGKTFFSLPDGPADSFWGVPINTVDGSDVIATERCFADVTAKMRSERGPAVVVLQVERLTSHTNADDQRIYRDADELERVVRLADPLLILERRLVDEFGFQAEELDELRGELEEEVRVAAEEAAAGPDPMLEIPCKRPLPPELARRSSERRGDTGVSERTMRDALRDVLHHHLETDEKVTLYGEDIEDPKGDVFGVTRGLSTAFPGRVMNSPLSESTILGASVGRALAGERPVAFIQFADFLPQGFNQLTAEMATMHWRTGGDWPMPVIVMMACGGYRPGLGPYHAQTFESVLAHSPGIDVLMPSTATDAAGMLNAAFASQRPTVILYPKSCLNDSSNMTSANVDQQIVPIGVGRKLRSGREITFVGWGNTVAICDEVATELEKVGVSSEVIDLRSLSPWDEQMVLASAERTARLVVVHEDNHSCGLGGELLATVAEKTRVPVALRRVTRPDTFVPCSFPNQVDLLPSLHSVLTVAAELLNLDLSWQDPAPVAPGTRFIEAIGSGPADEQVVVVELRVTGGQQVEVGDTIASLEATKSVFDLTAPFAGTVDEILVSEGDTIAVGAPLMRMQVSEEVVSPNTAPSIPVLSRRKTGDTLILAPRSEARRDLDVGIAGVAAVTGSRQVENADLIGGRKGMTADDILRRTGIETRHWAADGENAVNMAVRACWQVLEQQQISVDDLDLLICSTTSPTSVTPSMACQVLNGLSRGGVDVQAFDINAACSGYLYALQSGYDFLQSRPDGRVLVVTAEVLSPLLDPQDFDTAILFGDATSATLLCGETHFDEARARLYRPELSANGEDGSTLSVPFRDGGFIQMKGRKVFTQAVRSMVSSLNRVCRGRGIDVDELKLVVPHQANQRIIDAIQSRVGIDVFSNIRNHGNTSSTSIPLCLQDILPGVRPGDRLGLCAFGGGFTFGAGILEAS